MTSTMDPMYDEPDIDTVEFAGLKLIFSEELGGVGIKEDGEFVGAVDEKSFRKRIKRAADDFTTSPSTTHWVMFGSALWCDNEEEYAVTDDEGNAITQPDQLDECPQCGEEL